MKRLVEFKKIGGRLSRGFASERKNVEWSLVGCGHNFRFDENTMRALLE